MWLAFCKTKAISELKKRLFERKVNAAKIFVYPQKLLSTSSAQKQPPEKNFGNVTEKHHCWSFFLIKLQFFRSAAALKRDSSTGVFLGVCQIFKKTYFEHL